LEFLAFFLIVNYNKSQKEIWAYSSNLLSGNVYKKVENIQDFLELQEVNDSLLNENARLLETIINYRISAKNNAFQSFELQDSLREYQLIPARICNKTLNLRNNYITLCKGSRDSIGLGMGVISNKGVVGIVKAVSENFSTVQLVLNSQSRISAKINTKNYYGNLMWVNSDTRTLNLLGIPKHAEIEKGDSISTSGFSICFPPEIFIGQIEKFSVESGSNNYNIDVALNHDLSQLEYVYVIKFFKKSEKQTLLNLENE
jgi:rod shape-determining protein MreC